MPLAESWRRSTTLGISPDQHNPRNLHDASEVLQHRREHRLQQVTPALQDLLADDSSSGRHLLVLTDTTGEILWRVGSREALRRADRLESPGADWSEPPTYLWLREVPLVYERHEIVVRQLNVMVG